MALLLSLLSNQSIDQSIYFFRAIVQRHI